MVDSVHLVQVLIQWQLILAVRMRGVLIRIAIVIAVVIQIIIAIAIAVGAKLMENVVVIIKQHLQRGMRKCQVLMPHFCSDVSTFD